MPVFCLMILLVYGKTAVARGIYRYIKREIKYYGKIIWLTNDTDANGNPKVDRKNSNASLRSRPLIGLTMLRDFVYNNGEYSGGRIYNPSDG